MILKINDRIRTRKISFFNDFNIHLKYDAVASTFRFRFYFNPENIEHKEMACIGHYHLCTVEHNGELLITGQILSEALTSSAVAELVPIGGYSLPGPLEECQIPPEIYPLQSDALTLRQIAQKMIGPFGIQMIVDPIVSERMDQQFEESEAKASQTVKSYLAELAAQKNIVISHNEKGQLVFTQAPANQQPIFHFDGGLPATSMSLAFDGQGMHSHITVLTQADGNFPDAAMAEPIRNPYVINTVYRPKVIVQSSRSLTDDTDQAARNALAQELKHLQLKITTDRWELNDKVIRPGKEITVQNEKIFLYNKTRWLIEEVELTGTTEKQTAVLTCVLPEVYNGQTPTYIFKGINLH